MTNTNFQGSFCQKKPDITYPCLWEYKVIGKDRDMLTEVIQDACSPAIPDITLSNVSKTGKYFSLKATLEVENEEIRLEIFARIQKSSAVKMVI